MPKISEVLEANLRAQAAQHFIDVELLRPLHNAIWALINEVGPEQAFAIIKEVTIEWFEGGIFIQLPPRPDR